MADWTQLRPKLRPERPSSQLSCGEQRTVTALDHRGTSVELVSFLMHCRLSMGAAPILPDASGPKGPRSPPFDGPVPDTLQHRRSQV